MHKLNYFLEEKKVDFLLFLFIDFSFIFHFLFICFFFFYVLTKLIKIYGLWLKRQIKPSNNKPTCILVHSIMRQKANPKVQPSPHRKCLDNPLSCIANEHRQTEPRRRRRPSNHQRPTWHPTAIVKPPKKSTKRQNIQKI